MPPSKILLYLSSSFIVGILTASFVKIPQSVLWGIFICTTLCIILALIISKNKVVILGFCVLLALLGISRIHITQFIMESDVLLPLHVTGESVLLTGIIIKDPDIRDTTQKLTVDVDGSLVLVTTAKFPEYQYLDEIALTGKITVPQNFGDFNYQEYLAKDGIYSVMDYPVIEVVSLSHQYTVTTFLYEKVLSLKHIFLHSLGAVFLPPEDSLIQGIVFGEDKHMPKAAKDAFVATGLSHITAVSGSNIVIVISLVTTLLLALGFWRGQALSISILFIWLYIAVIGIPISGVRAVIMGSAILLAQMLGRQNTSSRVIVFTAALMLLHNPLLLRYDISFQLSFLASLGIIHVKPFFDDALCYLFHKKLMVIKDILSTTFAAQVFVVPITMYYFRTISLIAPVTNMLILPIIPLLTIFGFIISFVGIFFPLVSFIIAIPCHLLIKYIFYVVFFFLKPWTLVTLEHISLWWFVGYYGVLAIGVWYYKKSAVLKDCC